MKYLERVDLIQALAPLEVLCGQIKSDPYKEMTAGFQEELVNSIEFIRKFVFEAEILKLP